MMTSSTIPLLKRILCLVGLTAGLASCNVAESYRIVALGSESIPASLPQSGCKSTAGSYALSYTTWSFKIKQYPNELPFLSDLEPSVHPDSRFVYCLDYLASAFSEDQFSVGFDLQENKSGGLLSYVASFAVDQSSIVIRRLIRSIFVVLSRNPKFDIERVGGAAPKGEPVTLHPHEVDPLNAEKLAEVNSSIRDDGFCLVLRDYSFDDRQTDVQSYCNNPIRTVSSYPSPDLIALRRQRWLVDHPERGGVLYRPRLPYELQVYTKDDPTGPGKWSLRQTKIVMLENLSPVISLGIDRALFAQSHVGLEFDRGVLTNFCIARSSSVAGAVEIPLDIVYGLVSLPSRTIMAEIDRARSTKELVQAQTELILAQRQFIEFEKNKGGAKPDAKDAVAINGHTGCGGNACTYPDLAKINRDDDLAISVCSKITAAEGKQ